MDAGVDVGISPPPPVTPCPSDSACDAGACPVVALPGGAAGLVGWLAVGGDRVWWTASNLPATGYVDRCGGGGATVDSVWGGDVVAANLGGACWTFGGTLDAGTPQSNGQILCWSGSGVTTLATGQGGTVGNRDRHDDGILGERRLLLQRLRCALGIAERGAPLRTLQRSG